MSKIAGLVANRLKLKLVGKAVDGEIVKHGLALTAQKAFNILATAPAEKVKEETQFPVVITHCLNESDALTLKEMLTQSFNLTDIRVIQSRGLASFYEDYHGIVLGF
jgi:fatty acid-binding protein DegV